MPIYEMRAPNGRTYRIQGPAGATDDEVRAAILRDHPDAGKPAPRPQAPKPKEPSMLEAFQTGLDQAKLNTFNALMSGARKIGLVGPETKTEQQQRQNFRRDFGNRMQQVQQARPYSSGAGQLTGEIALTAPLVELGGAGITRFGEKVATKAPRAGRVIQNVGKNVQTGGIGSGRTAAESAALSRGARASQLLQRSTGGAIAGGGSAALTGQDAGEGAAFGAGLPIVGSIVKRVAGFAGDITKLPRQKAAEIIRKSLEDNVDKAREVFSKLSPNDRRLAEQVLIDAGIEPRTFFGVGKIAQEQIAPTSFAQTLEQQAAERQARLAQVSGGLNATERRAAAEEAARGVNEISGPLRETALQNIQQTNKAVLDAQTIADIYRTRADEMTASGFVPRMRGLETRSREQLDAVFQNPEFFTESRPVIRAGEIAEGAGQRADDAIAEQLRLRDLARNTEDAVAELAAQGREPLRAAPLSNLLRQQANAAGVKTSSARQALLKLANKIDGAADANGLLNPYDLYTLRKEASDIVEKYVSSGVQPSTGSKKRAAGLVMQFKTDVDNALGEEFKSYLRMHQQGMEAVNRQELASTAAQLADENAPEFIKLMNRQRPKIVETAMGRGTGNYDIADMALTDPNRYLALKQSADELSTLNRMAELRGEGAGAAGNLMIKERPSMLTRGLTAATMSSIPSLRIGAQGAEQVERALMTPRVQKEIGNAFLSGQNMADLINTYPTQARISEGVSNLSPMARNILAQMLRGYMTNPNY